MVNCYTDLETFKSRMGITNTTEDTAIVSVIKSVSRGIDNFTERKFYSETATKYFPGDSFLVIDDLLSVTTLKTDEDQDAAFENTLATTDYTLKPLNNYPKTRVEIADGSDYSGFGVGSKIGTELAGTWGYGLTATPYSSAGTLGADVSTTSVTTVTLASGHSVKTGNTLRIGTEQAYVSYVGSTSATIQRAVNGTTATTGASGATIYTYDYPEEIKEAALIQAMRLWKRKESAFANVISNEITGQTTVYKGLDPDVKQMISPFRRHRNMYSPD